MIAPEVHEHFHRKPGSHIWTNRAWVSRDGEILPVDWHRDLFENDTYEDAWEEGWARVYGKPDGEMGIQMKAACSRQQFSAFREMIADVQPSRLFCVANDNSTFSCHPETFRADLGVLAL